MSKNSLVLPEGNFQAYLFDMDGTIADSMPLHYLSWRQAVEEAGGTFPEDLFYAWGGVPLIGVVENLNKHFGYKLDPPAVAHRKESIYLSMLDQVTAVPSVLECILAAHGKIPFAIVSGSPRDSIRRTLTTLNLLDYFPVIIGAEDYTLGKPNPEPFLTAAKRLHIDPSTCLVFEDADAGIRSAEAAGMQWVRVPISVPSHQY
ncbi:HAD family hydrolase [Terriglobus tenax]|uniref:HAD family hydrolase n=1 Tax=Terriglobus tenax TaxID=1111115 RepID=UPI0021E0E7E2|nr:HAD family phosphatase [Terriglobus tenax]